MKRVELVFRTVGERTEKAALELAIQHIQPQRTHVIANVKPFTEAVRQQLAIDHQCDVVVYVDADCLILEDMRPFIEFNDQPYVDCYVEDRFRGRIHCGVHITRIDLVHAMQQVKPRADDIRYVLRPESRVRNMAMKTRPTWTKAFKGFHILHDFHQSYESIFEKYALRELRSRTDKQRPRLEGAMRAWGDSDDFEVARMAVRHARREVPHGADPRLVAEYIEALPDTAQRELASANLDPLPPIADFPPLPKKRCKVFGLGLSRTGTRSLTTALHVLGWDTIHYPTDAQSLADMRRADGRFGILDHYDGITDITTIPFFREIDAQYPDAKFILTSRDAASWIRSATNHWTNRPAFGDPRKTVQQLEVRRLLRNAVYGMLDFDRDHFAEVHRQHERPIREHFAGRPGKLLVYPLTAGAGWEPLCDFLDVPVPMAPFPHKGGGLSASMAAQ